jgi:hypothetical protein
MVHENSAALQTHPDIVRPDSRFHDDYQCRMKQQMTKIVDPSFIVLKKNEYYDVSHGPRPADPMFKFELGPADAGLGFHVPANSRAGPRRLTGNQIKSQLLVFLRPTVASERMRRGRPRPRRGPARVSDPATPVTQVTTNFNHDS